MDIVSYLLGKQSSGGGGSNLQEKSVTITENTTTIVNPDSGYDGLTKVNVTTNVSGADITEYFDTNITTQSGFGYSNIKKLPSLTIDDRLTSLQGYFGSWSGLEEIENISGGTNITTYDTFLTQCKALKSVNFNNFNTSSSTSFRAMFNTCEKLTNLDLSSFTSANVTDTAFMFLNCKSLTHLDIRNMIFDNVGTHTRMFGSNASEGPPNDCEIIVKSQTEKDWITSKFSRLTNVKTVAEL